MRSGPGDGGLGFTCLQSLARRAVGRVFTHKKLRLQALQYAFCTVPADPRPRSARMELVGNPGACTMSRPLKDFVKSE